MAALDPHVYLSMGLKQEEFDLIVSLLGREPNLVECGMFAVMWSEHCGYKYSRPVLSYFKRYRDALAEGGLENAGIVPLGDGMGLAMKVESHNHPSAVAPYQGAATGVGGIIRDIFTMGARPIASLNALRFGEIRPGMEEPAAIKKNKAIFEGVVAGIAGYGNCVGVPTVAGEVAFHKGYTGNPLVNAMSVGIVEVEKIATAGAFGPGNPVIYLGSATGRDGIHGATFASETLDEEGEDKRPNVQIGDPFAEKVLIEATLEALETGAVAAIQDMGAAGLTCSTIEMSSKGGVGMDIDLDLVPEREKNMTAYDLMLSESQERMLCVAHKGREQEVIDVFHKWGVHAVVIGQVTEGDTVVIRRHGEVAASLPAPLLTDHCPTYTTEHEEPESFSRAKAWRPDGLPAVPVDQALDILLGCPSLAGKEWVYEQYDQQVQTQTVVCPGAADAAVLAPRGCRRGVALKIDGNSRWTQQDPYAGGALAVAEAARNVACTGAVPAAVTDGLNFGSPTNPLVYWQFERAVRGIADAAEALETPVISGNVSFYNTANEVEIPPSPMIGMAGLLESPEHRLTMAMPAEGDIALLRTIPEIGSQQGLGASSWLAEVHGREEGVPVMPDLKGEKALCRWLALASSTGLVTAAHDVSEGGTLFALAEMCITGQSGAQAAFDGPGFSFAESDDSACFGEIPGWVIVVVPSGRLSEAQAALDPALKLGLLGRATGPESPLAVTRQGRELVRKEWSSMAERHRSAIPSLMKPPSQDEAQ